MFTPCPSSACCNALRFCLWPIFGGKPQATWGESLEKQQRMGQGVTIAELSRLAGLPREEAEQAPAPQGAGGPAVRPRLCAVSISCCLLFTNYLFPSQARQTVRSWEEPVHSAGPHSDWRALGAHAYGPSRSTTWSSFRDTVLLPGATPAPSLWTTVSPADNAWEMFTDSQFKGPKVGDGAGKGTTKCLPLPIS